jgi:hypothetical protein
VVLLDLFGNDPLDPENQLHVELAASMAISVIQDAWQRDGGELIITLAGDSIHNWSAHPSSVLFQEVASCLATLDAAEGLSQEGWKKQLGRIRRGSRPVVISTRSREEAALVQLGDETIWIDCRTDEIWKYFQLPQPQTTAEENGQPLMTGETR